MFKIPKFHVEHSNYVSRQSNYWLYCDDTCLSMAWKLDVFSSLSLEACEVRHRNGFHKKTDRNLHFTFWNAVRYLSKNPPWQLTVIASVEAFKCLLCFGCVSCIHRISIYSNKKEYVPMFSLDCLFCVYLFLSELYAATASTAGGIICSEGELAI